MKLPPPEFLIMITLLGFAGLWMVVYPKTLIVIIASFIMGLLMVGAYLGVMFIYDKLVGSTW